MGIFKSIKKAVSGDSSPWSAVASIAAPILGAGISAYGGYQSNVASAREAQKQRDWQEYMSSTAHQQQKQN